MPMKTATIKSKKTVTNVVEDMEKLEPLHIAGGNVKWYRCCWKQFGSIKYIITIDEEVQLQKKSINIFSHKKLFTTIHKSTV